MSLLGQDSEAVRADDRRVPAVASQRAYLRSGLPAVYRDGATAMCFLAGLETLLDPIVAMLDALPSHFTAEFAPDDILALMAAWLGVGLDETQTEEQRRDVMRHAARLSRARGTKAGLELALRLTFRDASLRVEDHGGVAWATGASAATPADGGFVVYCETSLPDERLSAIAAFVEQCKPVDATWRMKVHRPSGETEGTS